MKPLYIKYLSLCLLTVLISSCEEFTEVPMPDSQITGAAVFEDVSTANAALSDIYSRIRDNGVSSGSLISVTQLMGLYADELTLYGPGAEFTEVYNHGITPSNLVVGTFWTSAYSEIYAANAFIEGVGASQNITGETKDRFMGEALFLRAYLHFYLANLYGDIPYITTTDYIANKQAPKLPYSQVIDRIVSDLSEAKNLLPDNYPTSERVRANKAVVQAMLARVHLYNEEWELAEENATAVISNPMYTWEANPELVFLKDSPGIIWSLSAGEPGANTLDADSFIFSSGPPPISGISADLRNAFAQGDLRRDLWINTVTYGTDEWYHAYKYKQQFPTGGSQEYTIMFRLAEQYLIRAEGRAHRGNITGAQHDLNKVRNRAGLADTLAESAPDLLAAILNETALRAVHRAGAPMV